MTFPTFQDVVDLARQPLKDNNSVDADRRYPDAEILSYVNQGVLVAVDECPHLFIGSFSSLPAGNNALTDNFPLPRYMQALADYASSRCDLEENETADDGRTQLLMKLGKAELGVA